MGNQILIYTTYPSGSDFGGLLRLSKFDVKKDVMNTGSNGMCISFEGKGDVKGARIYLDYEIAVPLAHNMLNIAEGHATTSEYEIK
jgi:hypothetical protein